jgi:putative peptidoglycan lipid II flippase
VVVGTLLQCIVLGGAVQRLGVPLRLRWTPRSPELVDTFQQYVPVVAGLVLASSSLIIDQSMSAMLGSGSVAVFNYGTKVVSSLQGVAMIAIGTSVLPRFSRLAAREDWGELRRSLVRYGGVVFVAAIPITVAIVLGSRPLIRTLFERGAFLPQDTEAVSFVQQLFALQMPFYLTGILLVRLISAVRQNRLIFWVASGNAVLNIAFNLLLMRRFGVAGIALATTLVYVVSTIVLGIILWRHLTARR